MQKPGIKPHKPQFDLETIHQISYQTDQLNTDSVIQNKYFPAQLKC